MGEVSLLSALTQKMRWHQQRQDILAQNVANADTPGYKGHDLKALDFGTELGSLSMTPVTGAGGSSKRMAISALGSADGPGESVQQANFEVTPEGNGVTIEDEMMKVASNQMDYQTITSLYTKSLQLIKTAIGQV